MSAPFGQQPASFPPDPPQRPRPKIGPSTWITAAVVLLFVILGAVADGVGGALVILALVLLITGLYALISGRRSWLQLPARKWGAITTGAAVVLLVLGAALVPSSDEPKETAASRNTAAGSTPTKTAKPSATASAKATVTADPEASAKAESSAKAKADADAAAKAKAEADAAAKAQADADAKAKAEADAKAKAEAAGTISQQSALRSASDYLKFMPFSRSGLIEQLEYESYSTEDATWAVDRVSVDWNAQAAKSAKSYLDMMGFSHAGLVEQLMFEGYTLEQAEFGVSQTGL